MATSADATAFPGPDDLEAAATSAIEDFEAAADLDQLAAPRLEGRRRPLRRLPEGDEAGAGELQAATMWFMANGMKNPNDLGAGAVPYMHLVGIVAVGLMWLRMASAAARMKMSPLRTKAVRLPSRL